MLPTVLGLATLVGGAAVLVPRVTATVADPVDTSRPFSSFVTITNTGFIPLDKVGVTLGVHNIIVQSGLMLRGVDGAEFPTRMHFDNIAYHDLGLDDRFAFALNEMWGASERDKLIGTDTVADLAIIVEYDIPIIHWRREKIFPLILRRQTNGNFYWYATEK